MGTLNLMKYLTLPMQNGLTHTSLDDLSSDRLTTSSKTVIFKTDLNENIIFKYLNKISEFKGIFQFIYNIEFKEMFE